MSVEKEVYMDKFKKTMVKSLAVILILAMCLGFAACEPKDDTVYQFEEAIENLYGKFKIKLEKNWLTEIERRRQSFGAHDLRREIRYDRRLFRGGKRTTKFLCAKPYSPTTTARCTS